jgi:hypothetical protein
MLSFKCKVSGSYKQLFVNDKYVWKYLKKQQSEKLGGRNKDEFSK